MIKAILRTPAQRGTNYAGGAIVAIYQFSKILTSLVDMKLKPRQAARFSNVFI